MAYTDDTVLAKLSALNETQESIVTVAQWVMFHRRHADRTGQLWLQRLKDSNSNKRLNLIYLANEVVQQSKARRKDDFLIAFSPVIAEATATAYKGASSEVQQKLRRVVEVWRQRLIFEAPIQEAIEARIDEIDKTRSSGKRGLLDSSLFSKGAASVPNELVPLVNPQQTISKLTLSTRTSLNAAYQDYDKLTDPNAVTPSAPVHAARLNGLLKTLACAEGAVAEVIKARKVLIENLEKILDSNRVSLMADESQFAELANRRVAIDKQKKDVEDSIMRGFATTSNPSTPAVEGTPGQLLSPTTPAPEPDRPEVEALTPPSQSPRSPTPETYHTSNANPIQESIVSEPEYAPPEVAAGSDLLASLSGAGPYNPPQGSNGSAKKRKLNDIGDFPDLGGDAMDGIDADVAEMLRNSGSTG